MLIHDFMYQNMIILVLKQNLYYKYQMIQPRLKQIIVGENNFKLKTVTYCSLTIFKSIFILKISILYSNKESYIFVLTAFQELTDIEYVKYFTICSSFLNSEYLSFSMRSLNKYLLTLHFNILFIY